MSVTIPPITLIGWDKLFEHANPEETAELRQLRLRINDTHHINSILYNFRYRKGIHDYDGRSMKDITVFEVAEWVHERTKQAIKRKEEIRNAIRERLVL